MNRLFLTGIFIMMIMSNGCKSEQEREPAINPANMDLSVSPAKDFYQYANGGWMKNHPLKPEYGRYGSFDKLAEDNQARLKDLAEKLASDTSIADPVSKMTGLFFKTGMDSAKAENLGI